ncbi:hypothetical protein DPM19_34030 [Actinomadura craniellae]|uniref:Uncharacterized protein n=1 Tax=Actinomadura craniellae TaxID=2231787 RepID=A0A365GV52_9ACTN|nr:hypothetical protein [Actinomadura craniellae]RAY10677.1 hypothetical protein DPM19_34030 [Actinomadura craniellae]
MAADPAGALTAPTHAPPLGTFRTLRRTWLAGTILLSLGAFAAAILLAPSGSAEPGRALAALLFLGSSVHVASTGWFYTLPEIRAHALAHRGRYVVAPLALIAGTALAAVLVPYEQLQWALLAYFAWQFFHFQKQNLGMAALAGVSQRAGSVLKPERLGIVVAGCGGIAGLVLHPELLQLGVRAPLRSLFPAAFAVFAAGVALGLYALARRPTRPAGFVIVYLISLLFFTPVFVFTSPYAAVAGLTVAHGFQYLLIMGLISGAPRPHRSGLTGLTVMLTIAVTGGAALSYASHLHGSPMALERALYGAYLGAVMAHFVIDAGLWRLREEFPRRFLTASVPYLLRP